MTERPGVRQVLLEQSFEFGRPYYLGNQILYRRQVRFGSLLARRICDEAALEFVMLGRGHGFSVG